MLGTLSTSKQLRTIFITQSTANPFLNLLVNLNIHTSINYKPILRMISISSSYIHTYIHNNPDRFLSIYNTYYLSLYSKVDY